MHCIDTFVGNLVVLTAIQCVHLDPFLYSIYLPSVASITLIKKKKKLQLNFEAMMRVQTWLSAFGGVLFLLCSEEKELSVLYFFLIYVNFNFLCACAYMCPVLVPQKLKPRPLGWSQYVWPYGVILRSCCSAFADE